MEQVHLVVEVHDGVPLLARTVVVVAPVPLAITTVVVVVVATILACGALLSSIPTTSLRFLRIPLTLPLVTLVVVAHVVATKLGKRLVSALSLILQIRQHQALIVPVHQHLLLGLVWKVADKRIFQRVLVPAGPWVQGHLRVELRDIRINVPVGDLQRLQVRQRSPSVDFEDLRESRPHVIPGC